MRRAAALVVAALLAGCSVTALTVDTDLEQLKGKAVVVYFGDPAEISKMCADWGLPGSVACVAMATSPAEKTKMLWEYSQRMTGFGLDCVVLAPPSPEALMHELTLCALRPKWYPNSHDPKA
jgi:hypothetical protein